MTNVYTIPDDVDVSRIQYVGRYESDELASFSEGDVVEYSDGNYGVITAEMTSTFEWPTGDDSEESVEASSENPVYVVARETGGSAPFEADELNEADQDSAFGDSDADPSKLADDAEMAPIYSRISDPFDAQEFNRELEELINIPGVDDPGVGFDELPDGWDRTSVLDAWASLGGTFTSCRAQMSGEIRSPARFCAALKDETLGTEMWRGKF